jgi:hypothetical protein
VNWIKLILRVFTHVLKTLAYKWVYYVINIVKRFRRNLKAFRDFKKLSHAEQDKRTNLCGVIDNPAFHRPDPCIYDQYYLMSLGLAVTWDNPDIILLQGGVVVPKHGLLPNTEYEIDATIWNNSFEAPVVGLRVSFGYLTFGASTTLTPIGFTYVNLGVKGGPDHPAIAKMLWKTPTTPGHYCIQVQLECADDANPNNNLGQNNVDVVAAHSPANFSFTLKNPTDTANAYHFEVDTYAIPAQPDCPPTIEQMAARTRAERLNLARAAHNPANFPVPTGWTVEIVPSQVTLAAGDEAVIKVSVTPPPGFVGTKPFNVNAISKDLRAGGVTLYVLKT